MIVHMDRDTFTTLLTSCPVIAAIKNDEGLAASLSSPCLVVFVLFGSIMDIPDIVNRIHAAGKAPIVHIDLIEGLAARESAVDFIRFRTLAAGIISTKGILIRRAKELNLIAIQRFFLLDSLALTNIRKMVATNEPDVIEVIPGAMPRIIRDLCEKATTPLIAGGLIRDHEDVENALNAGASAISSTNNALWMH